MITLNLVFLALAAVLLIALFFVDDKDTIILLAVVLGLVWGIMVLVMCGQQEKTEFMAQCLTEHKQYECTAMWRAGDHDTTFIYSGR